MPLFSIIIPVYNAANTLAQTLQSVIDQSYTNYEVCLVNDGSTDDSAAIIEEYLANHHNFSVINQKNRGLGQARNCAAIAAKGEWLVFLDADDYWAPHKLQLLANAIALNPQFAFIYHQIFELYPNGRMRARNFWQVNSVEEFIAKGNPFVPSAIAIKKDIFLAANGFVEDRNQVEDLVLWLRFFNAKISMLALATPLTIYRMATGVTGRLEDHLQKVEGALQLAIQEKLITPAQYQLSISRKYYEAARQLHKLGEHEKAKSFYLKGGRKSLTTLLLIMLNTLRIAI